MRVAIAGAGSVPSIARELLEKGRRPAHRPFHPSRSSGQPAWRGVAARRRLRDQLADEAALDRCNVVIAATGDDQGQSVVSLLAKTEYGSPESSRGSTTPTTSGSSTSPGAWTWAVSDPPAAVRTGRGGGQRRRPGPADDVPAERGEPGRADLSADARWSAAGSGTSTGRGHGAGRHTAGRAGHRAQPDDPLEAGDELLFVASQEVEDQLASLLASP